MKPTKLGVLLAGVAESALADVTVTDIVTDSRKAGEGSVFVAIVGERMDGNDYAMSALANGAAACIVSRPMQDERCILVKDTRDALCAMAGNYRRQFSPVVAGVTGSVGKTTTKEMLAAIFARFGNMLKNEGNRNNEIGMPETVLRMDDATELAVFEMGMSDLGEISRLSRCAQPQAGIITCVGVSHIESLGSRENIRKAKLEILDGMPEDGLLALNADDEMLMAVLDDIPVRTVLFGIENPDADVTAADIHCKGFPTDFTIVDRDCGSFRCTIPCSGIHSVMDALSAYALATRLGFDPATCAAALADYQPAGMRQRFRKVKNITMIEDCYNANPDSMAASLQTLADLPCDGIRIAVLGDMLELGDISASSHEKVGLLAAKLGIDVLLCCGEQMKLAANAAAAAGMKCVEHFENKLDIADYLQKTAHAGDMILYKASRGMALEDIMQRYYDM
ncbi:MAG: UDP-N-acetylmuramoyl-tripeptide--D-alanyl-D-alanine ligase [Oscillospiraceae bacterium]|nr:UDP-N-acetylmuramoyl-tripeptide--D-alanyl-D-alanine ligase [Oscillospiraceae bacterium]